MAEKSYEIGFVGAGKMAQALVRSITAGGVFGQEQILCSDVAEEQREKIKQYLQVAVTSDNAEVLKCCKIVVLACKPQNFPEAVARASKMVRPEQIIISIMAGIRIEQIRQVLPGKVVRVMPNTACLVGEMAAGFATAADVKQEDIEKVEKVLQCAGLARRVSEEQLDAVTGLSGSGPAFVAYLIDSFVEAAVTEGLDKQVSRELALQTFSGTAKLLAEWDMEPSELIEMVSSPNGTTVAGREVLESSKAREIIVKTIQRAAERSRELGK